MQRRLTIALVVTALASILLVGFGVLAMARFGAQANAERQIERPLNTITDFLDDPTPRTRLRSQFEQSRVQFGLEQLEFVLVSNDGSVTAAGQRRLEPSSVPDISLNESQRANLTAGETVLISDRSQVVGLRRFRNNGQGQRDGTLAVLATQPVRAVSQQALVWFVLSSAVVLVAAIGAGLWMARRLSRPIQAIKTTTSAIAAGDLGARVDLGDSARTGDELDDLGRSVNQMAADLQRSKALDRQFLMSVSHDLRTPLTAIAGYAEALTDGAVTDSEQAGRIIKSNTDRLDMLVGDLLDLARLDANRFRLDIRSFDLGVVAARTVAGLQADPTKNEVAIDTSGLASVLAKGDPDRTAQAIGNLVDNAMKFAERTVWITCGVDEHMAIVRICDDGPGIPDADLPHVFNRLYTGAAQPERAENPTGLGLAIVRELVAAMGGRVKASNGAEGGACLQMDLPLGVTAPETAG